MNKKTFLKQSGLAFFIRVLGALSGLLMNLVITRNLSVEQSGLFFLAFAICSAIGMLCTLGLTNAFIRFIGGYHAEDNWPIIKGVFLKGVKAVLITSVIAAVITFAASSYIGISLFDKPELVSVLRIITFAIPCFALYQITAYAFQGLHKSAISIFLQNISNQLIMVFLIALVVSFSITLTVVSVTTIFTCSAAVTCLCGLIKWFKQKELDVFADFSKTNELIASAKPLFLIMTISMLVQYSGLIIVGAYLEAVDVSLFSVAQRIAMLTSFVLVAVNLVAAPRFAAIARLNNPEELRNTSLFCSRIMVVMAMPIMIFMLLFPEFLMGLFGKEYKQGAYLLRILAIGQFINVITGSVGYLLNMTGHEKDFRNVVFLSGPLALGLGLWLTPIYGAAGAAVATAIALASQNLLAVFMVKKRLGFNTLNLWK
jgi:O-antigen/teichoic acid export membrane protein